MKAFTIAVPRYALESAKGDHLDIFNKRVNAIKAAIKMASEYPGNTFVVVKKHMHKRKVIFSFKLDVQLNFEDVHSFNQAMIDVFQAKLNKTRFWRKKDGSGN